MAALGHLTLKQNATLHKSTVKSSKLACFSTVLEVLTVSEYSGHPTKMTLITSIVSR